MNANEKKSCSSYSGTATNAVEKYVLEKIIL